jgi:hypothetical protein
VYLAAKVQPRQLRQPRREHVALKSHGQLDPGPLELDPLQGLIDELPESDQELLRAVGRVGARSVHHGSGCSRGLLTSP